MQRSLIFCSRDPTSGKFAVVGRRTHDQRVVFENVADDIRNVGIRKVVNDDVFYTLYGQLPSDFLGHLGRIAIHRTIGDHHTRFAFVATQLIVDTYYAPDFLLPYGAVRRADRFDGKAAQFLEGFLYGGAVFAHDAGVVAAHLVPEMVQRKLAVQDTAVQGTERAERIRREEYLVFGAIGDHHFGPVNHRRHIEREVFLAERNAFALFDFPGEGMDAVISVEHLKGFGIAHDLHLGVEQAQGFAALTGLDEENILLSLYANDVSNAKTVTKINRSSFNSVINEMNLGSIIYPRVITADYILKYVRSTVNSINSNVETLYKLAGGKAEALEFIIKENSAVAGIPLQDLNFRKNTLICCIYRNGKVILPGGQDMMLAGDSVLVVISGYRISDIKEILED